MKVSISNIGKAGLNTDLSPWDLSPDYLTGGRNFRVISNRIESVNGLRLLTTTPDDNIGHIRQITNWNNQSSWALFGASDVNGYDGVTFTSIAPGSFIGVPTESTQQWSTAQVGQVMFASHPDNFPMYWSDGAASTPMEWLPWKPSETWETAGKQCRAIRSHKNFLFGLGMIEGGSDIYDRVRWSHPAEPNGIPYTWEAAIEGTDESSLAGWVDLGSGGRIVEGRQMRDSFVIYSKNAINILDFVGGAFQWQRRQMSTDVGCLDQECVAEVKGTHFFMSGEDVLMFDGNSIRSILHQRLRRRFASRQSDNAVFKSFTVVHYGAKEIWFCVTELGFDFPNVAYVYNYQDDTISIRDIATDGAGVKHAWYGVSPTPDVAWDDLSGRTWGQGSAQWGAGIESPPSMTLIGVNDQRLFDLDPQTPQGNVNCMVERSQLAIGGHDITKTVTRLYPHMSGSAEVTFTIGSHQQAGGNYMGSKSGAAVFKPGKDRKLDMRATGELHTWRVESNGPGYWRLSGIDIEVEEAGKR